MVGTVLIFPWKKTWNQTFSWFCWKNIFFFHQNTALFYELVQSIARKSSLKYWHLLIRKKFLTRSWESLISRIFFAGKRAPLPPIFYYRLLFLDFFRTTYIFPEKNVYISKSTPYCIQRPEELPGRSCFVLRLDRRGDCLLIRLR